MNTSKSVTVPIVRTLLAALTLLATACGASPDEATKPAELAQADLAPYVVPANSCLIATSWGSADILIVNADQLDAVEAHKAVLVRAGGADVTLTMAPLAAPLGSLDRYELDDELCKQTPLGVHLY